MQNVDEKIVLDLETKKGFDEVGRNRLGELGVSVVGIYSYEEKSFRVFTEQQLQRLIPYFQKAKLIIGFNIKRFDYPVLQAYLDFDLNNLNTLDIFEEVHNRLGFRLGLDSLARATLNTGKTGSGLDALKYFRNGEIDKLKSYCEHDVLITRDIYEYGQDHGHLLYYRGLSLERIPVSWSTHQAIDVILKEAFTQHRTLKIEYSTPFTKSGQRHSREIDIYEIELGRIIAFCHLRKAMRTFNISRILSAKITDKAYEIPSDFDLRAFKAKQKF
jgi:hypothetical protein